MALSRLNYIHSRENGRLASTTPDDIDGIVEAFKGQAKVVLHFHGGLVDEANGFRTAERLLPTYTAAGAYPVSFIWRSGLLETIRGNLPEIFSEDVFKTILRWVTRYAIGKVKQQPGERALGVLQTPSGMDVEVELARRDAQQEPYAELAIPDDVEPLIDAELEQFQQELAADGELEAQRQAIVNALLPEPAITTSRGAVIRTRESAHTLMSPEVVAELKAEAQPPEGERGLVSGGILIRKAAGVLIAVVKRFREKTDHGVYPTILEEILRALYLTNVGGAVWNFMKRDTEDTFADSSEVRAGRYFLDKLSELLATGDRPEITLIGHSAGAVFIDNLLNDVERRRGDPQDPFPEDFRFENLVYLAPACTFTHCASMISRGDHLFERFRMFTMTDTAEQADWLVSFVYPRSLLYFISGVLERDPDHKSTVLPLVGMQRFYLGTSSAADAAVVTVRDFVISSADRAVWSPGDRGVGLSSGATTHTAFDDDPKVLASIADLIER